MKRKGQGVAADDTAAAADLKGSPQSGGQLVFVSVCVCMSVRACCSFFFPDFQHPSAEVPEEKGSFRVKIGKCGRSFQR